MTCDPDHAYAFGNLRGLLAGISCFEVFAIFPIFVSQPFGRQAVTGLGGGAFRRACSTFERQHRTTAQGQPRIASLLVVSA
jgi:hypothetical protein